MNKEKVFFNISLGKTATTSIHNAAIQLGFAKSKHYYPYWIKPKLGNFYSDATTASMYRQYLGQFGDKARFLYIERDLEDWLYSWERHDKKLILSEENLDNARFRSARLGLYGQLNFDKDVWATKWLTHREDVLKVIPASQLVYHQYWLELSDEWKWSTICNFFEVAPELAKTMIKRPFPRSNVGARDR